MDLLKKALIERAQRPRDEGDESSSAFARVKDFVSTVQKELLEETKTEIEKIETQLGQMVGEVFAGFKVSFEAKSEEIGEKAISFFSTNPTLRMGPQNGHMAPIDKQGSGARRTLLWATLKLLGEQPPTTKQSKAKAKKQADTAADVETLRPNVLLIDEPEICLHPNAIREACRVLYDVAKPGNNWQVMVTTHSPVFIDISRDNTTIIRVEWSRTGNIQGTTVFRPDRVKLNEGDREMLKLLNLWDPYLAEFFFGGRTILVEGDTEYSVFCYLMAKNRDEFKDVHVVRARGKAILVPLIKILNHFGSGYAVVHDSDNPQTKSGKSNSAWSLNEAILNTVNGCPDPSRVRLVASVPNFEEALFGSSPTSNKPYNAVMKIKGNPELERKAEDLLKALLDRSKPLPSGVIAWSNVEQLRAALPS